MSQDSVDTLSLGHCSPPRECTCRPPAVYRGSIALDFEGRGKTLDFGKWTPSAGSSQDHAEGNAQQSEEDKGKGKDKGKAQRQDKDMGKAQRQSKGKGKAQRQPTGEDKGKAQQQSRASRVEVFWSIEHGGLMKKVWVDPPTE